MIRPQPPTSVERSVEASETAAVISGVDGTGAANTCTLGRTGPGGGIVFYVNPTDMPGRYYMETSPSGWSGGTSDLARNWNGAMSAASAYTGGGVDWFLPPEQNWYIFQ